MALTIHAGNKENSLFVTNEHAASRHEQGTGKENRKSTIYAKDLAVRPDSILLKRQQAQKQAMKVMGDVFASDKSLDQSMDEMMVRAKELQEENAVNSREIRRIADTRTALMESYDVTVDSREHKDLELLRKEKEASQPLSEIELSDEELQRLEDIHKAGLTDYQKDMLELDDAEEVYQTLISDNEKQVKGIQMTLSDIKIERLKSHPMVDAGKQAEEIMEAANREIYGQLVNEGKEHIEEKMEEEKEKALERAEKKEEEEKKAQEKKEEKRAETEEVKEMDRMASYNSQKPKLDKEMEEILDELKLIQDDLKGAAVDTNI